VVKKKSFKSSLLLQDYPLHQLSSVVFFLLPLLVLSYLYIRMGLSLYQAKVALAILYLNCFKPITKMSQHSTKWPPCLKD
jgi:hypothetical protein